MMLLMPGRPSFNQINHHVAVWDYNGQAVETPYVTNDDQTDLLVIPGFGENYTDRIARVLAFYKVSAAVCALECPLDIDINEQAIEQTIFSAIPAVTESMNIKAQRDRLTPVYGASHSVGFAKMAKLATVQPDRFMQITASAPFGINSALKPRQIMQRMRKDVFVNIKSDNPRMYEEVRAGAAYIRSHNSAELVAELHALDLLKTLVIGEDDVVSPPDECNDILQIPGLVEVTHGGHDPLFTSVGMSQLILAIKKMKANK